MSAEYNRRDFMKFSASLGAGLALGGLGLAGCGILPKWHQASIEGLTSLPLERIRVGFVGVGARGSSLINVLLNLEAVEIRAICDIKEDKVALAQKRVEEAGQPKPEGYSRGETDFKRLCDRDDLDLVINATPWQWHTPISVAALKAGKHAATEVPAAVTIKECWQLVETAEKARKHCVMLENYCYFRNVLMVLNMVRQGLFGDLVHCEAGYQHERIKKHFDSTGKMVWRTEHYVKRDGNPYPTHQIGPVAQWMNINRGDRFDYLVSMSGKSRALNFYAAEFFGEDHPLAKKKYALGDINTSLIRTVNGLTVTLYHDTQLPRPYDLIYRVQGLEGIYMGTLDKIYIRGRSPEEHAWESIDNYVEEFEHPLWKSLGPKAKEFGHGGADYITLYRLIHALRTGTTPDMNVYDAATWSVISELTERSVAKKSRSVDFPDFTRGKWKTNPPLGIVGA